MKLHISIEAPKKVGTQERPVFEQRSFYTSDGAVATITVEGTHDLLPLTKDNPIVGEEIRRVLELILADRAVITAAQADGMFD
jgi:hypothetical protein